MADPNRPFDLVVLDLDGTILDKRYPGGFSPAVVQTIAAVQAAGTPVTIATGRILDYVKDVTQTLKITLPVVTTQGAVVADPATSQVIYQALLPDAAVEEVARWVDETQRVTALYITNGVGKTVIYQNREVQEAAHYDHWFGTPRRLVPRLSDLLAEVGTATAMKFITYNALVDEADLTAELQARFPLLHITRTHDLLVEGTAAGVDKGEGVRHLLEHLQIDPARVMAIGDNENDIPILKLVGFGVAMGQASEKVKALADWIAPSIDEDGAAVALRKFILQAG